MNWGSDDMHSAANDLTTEGDLPLDRFQLSRLAEAVDGLTRDQLTWASGYLAGMGAARSAPAPATAAEPSLTILYASVGGNARAVAEALAEGAAARGLAPRLASVDGYRARDLAKEKLVYLVISTQGEGEPPEGALELFRYLKGKKPPQLGELEYAVFGLGDSSYEFFNQAAKDLDQHLQDLGATSVVDRVDADVDYEAHTEAWYAQVLEIAEKKRPSDSAQVIPLQRQAPSVMRHDRNHPYEAEVLDNRRITTGDAIGEVHNLVLEIDPEVIRYQPGDSLGVLFRNDPALVDQVLALTGLSADATVSLQGRSLTLQEALVNERELTQLHPSVVSAWAEQTGNEQLLALREDKAQLRTFAGERQLIDLLAAYPAEVTADVLVGVLQALQPRLYSIASSQAETPDEVHLTVTTVEYEAFGREHLGGASGHLTRRVEPGDVQAVYVAENNGFRLPQNGDTPIIMVGAGTGIAPFRAFLQERAANSASGRNWLVFGNRHFHRDFLYQTEWIAHRDAGLLHEVSLAFSRDSDDRPYVQDRLRETGAEVYRWLQEGAHFYVCGGLAMAREVQDALQAIVETHGGLDAAAAAEYIEELQAQGRYQKDAY